MTIWVIGGLDPSGGAGILRDLWTLESLCLQPDVHVLLSAWTWQGDGRPARAEAMDGTRLLEIAAALPSPKVIKLGLVPAPLVDSIRVAFDKFAPDAEIILDPVWRSSDGGDLGSSATTLLPLIERARLLTPNVDEARWILRAIPPSSSSLDLHAGGRLAIKYAKGAQLDPDPDLDPDPASDLAQQLARRFPQTGILVKGGHVAATCVSDTLWDRGQFHRFKRPRWPESCSPRGTGCALASAIAFRLARGDGLPEAVAFAIAWLDRARQDARPGPDGRPHLAVPLGTRVRGLPAHDGAKFRFV